jgi:hypothetical protein
MTVGHDLESVYLTHMRAAREDGFAAMVRHALTAQRATHLRTACWAAAQLAEQCAHHSSMQALAWSRRCCDTYTEYRAAAVPAWVRSMAVLAGVTLLTNEVQDPLFVTVQRVRRQWAESPELSFG